MRRHLERWLPSGSFIRRVGILTSGTVFAQGLAFLALPLLTRLYTPEDFSILAIYTAILGIVATIACGRYNLAVPIPPDDEDALALLLVALLIAFFSSGLIALLAVLFSREFAALFTHPSVSVAEIQKYSLLLPFGVFAYSAYDALQYWTSRKHRYDVVVRSRISRAIGGIGTQVSWGSISSGPLGLLTGHVVYGAFGIIELVRDLITKDQTLFHSLSWEGLKRQAKKYQNFPRMSVPEALLNVAGLHIPIILIGSLHPGPEAGNLMLAMTVIGAPMALVGSSISQVYLTEAPARLRSGTLVAFTRQTMMTMFKYSAPPILLLGLVSPSTFTWIFGAEWDRAGWLVLWMTPWFIAQFVASPLSAVLVVAGKMLLALSLQILGVVFRVGAVVLVAASNPDRIAEAFAVSSALFYVLYCSVIYSITFEEP